MPTTTKEVKMSEENRDAEIAAFNGVEHTETPATTVIEEVIEQTPEVKEAADPMQEILSRLEKAEQLNSKLAGHIGGLTRSQKEMQEKLSAAQAVPKSVDAPSKAQVAQAASDPEEWERMRTEFPEFTNATESFLNSKLSNFKPENKQEELDKLSQELAEVKKSSESRVVDLTLRLAHPDWLSVVRKQEFLEFMNKSNLPDSQDPDVVADYITRYKSATKPPEPKQEDQDLRRKRLESAIPPRGSGGTVVKHDQTELDAFNAAFKS